MSLALFMNHNVPAAITDGLRLRGADVLTAYEDGSHLLDDPELLARASELGRVLLTMDRDLLAVAGDYQRAGKGFPGVIYAHPLRVSIGSCVRDLELLTSASDPEDLRGRVEYLPLR